MKRKPTIEELQKILDKSDNDCVNIKPDGSLTVKKGKYKRPKVYTIDEALTKSKDLGQSY